MRRQVANRSLWLAYAKTLSYEASGLALGALAPPMIARRFGPDGFGQYSIIYELLAVVQPVLLLGLGVAVPRFVAPERNGTDRTDGSRYLAAALCLEGLVLLAVASAAVGSDSRWPALVFGGKPPHSAALVLSALVSASVFWVLVTGHLRGMGDHATANRLLLWYTGPAPILGGLLSSSVSSFFLIVSLGWAAGSLLALRPWSFKWNTTRSSTQRAALQLLGFGLRRVPGEMALFGLFSVPALAATRLVNLRTGGYVAFAVSVVTILGACFVPISMVLLPYVSALAAANRLQEVRAHLQKAVPISLAVAIALVGAVELAVTLATRVYLGEEFMPSVQVTRIVCLALPGYVLFIVCRSVLDAIFHKAVSLRWPTTSFIVFLVLLFVGPRSVYGIAVPFVVAVNLMGVLACSSLRSALGVADKQADSTPKTLTVGP